MSKNSIRKNAERRCRNTDIGDRASEYWEWGELGEKCWLRFTTEKDFSQMPDL
jgi:hypothetical protein